MAAIPGPGKQLRVRRSVRELEKIPKELNAFLRAWKRIKALPPDNPNSFWAIAGYHGEPFKPRPKDPEVDGWDGWCQHANVLFPTWHRFYVLRLEQALRTVCPEDNNVAMPYWDETSEESQRWGLPAILTNATVTIDGKQEQNPLLSFTFPEQIGGSKADKFYEKPPGYTTVRYPWSGIMSPPEAKKQAEDHNKMVEVLPNPTQTLNNNITRWLNKGQPHTCHLLPNSVCDRYNKCLKQGRYNIFSNTESATRWWQMPLEQPHNDIHLALGGYETPVGAEQDPVEFVGILPGANGDIGENETAAFDPIFFFHHSNIDRVFWIWQKIYGHTDSFDIVLGDPGTNPAKGQGPTPDQSKCQDLTMDTPLTPFQHPNGLPVNSKDCINIKTQLGYTYSKGSLEREVYPDPKAQKRDLAMHTVSKLADIHAILAEAGKQQYPPKVIFDVTKVQDWRGEGTTMKGQGVKIPIARFEWIGKHKLGVGNIDKDKYPGSILIRAYYKQVDPQHFIGQVGILDRWNRKKCANCQFHRFAGASFSLKEFILTWPPKINTDFKVQVVYKDPMKGTQRTDVISPGAPARSADDVPGPTINLLRVFTAKSKK